MTIHIGNLSVNTTEEDLMKLFAKFGVVKSVKIIKYPATESKGYGFIDTPADSKEQKAIRELKTTDVKAKNISADKTRSRN